MQGNERIIHWSTKKAALDIDMGHCLFLLFSKISFRLKAFSFKMVVCREVQSYLVLRHTLATLQLTD